MKNKNPNVRTKIAQYFLVILMTYPTDIIEKNHHHIDSFLSVDLQDARAEVRQIARHCFIKYKELFPNKAKQIYF